MKTTRQIPLGMLNISANPHPDGGATYVELLEAAAKVDKIISLGRDQAAMLESCVHIVQGSPFEGLTGEIHKFTELSGDWENTLTRKPATDEDLAKISIPGHMKPNREAFRYFFFPRNHRLVFQMKGGKRSIGHRAVMTFFQKLFDLPEVKARIPMVAVTIEQEPEALDKILKLHRLDHLSIHIERPNPDDVAPEDIAYVDALCRNQGARGFDVLLHHAPGESLNPNEDNTRLARVAATSNGHVIGIGYNENNRKVTLNTEDHPVIEPFAYDQKLKASLFEQMLIAARSFLDRVVQQARAVLAPEATLMPVKIESEAVSYPELPKPSGSNEDIS